MNQELNAQNKPTLEEQIEFVRTEAQHNLNWIDAVENDGVEQSDPMVETARREVAMLKAIEENLIAVKIWNAAHASKPVEKGCGDDYPVIPQPGHVIEEIGEDGLATEPDLRAVSAIGRKGVHHG